MPALKTGSRLRSQVDITEVIIVKASAADVELLIGGHPAIDLAAEPTAGLEPVTADEPVLVGKRYTNDAGDLEVLVTKAGASSGLSVDGTALFVKESKPLPSSD